MASRAVGLELSGIRGAGISAALHADGAATNGNVNVQQRSTTMSRPSLLVTPLQQQHHDAAQAFKAARAHVAFDLPSVKTKKRSDFILLPNGAFKYEQRRHAIPRGGGSHTDGQHSRPGRLLGANHLHSPTLTIRSLCVSAPFSRIQALVGPAGGAPSNLFSFLSSRVPVLRCRHLCHGRVGPVRRRGVLLRRRHLLLHGIRFGKTNAKGSACELTFGPLSLALSLSRACRADFCAERAISSRGLRAHGRIADAGISSAALYTAAVFVVFVARVRLRAQTKAA